MTPDQIDQLLAFLASANVLGKLEETGPDVWEDGLGDLDPDDAFAVARQLIRTHRWVKIADVREGVAKLREERLRNFVYEPPADRDPRYLQRLRGQIRAVASGAVAAPTERPALTGGPHPSVAEHLAGIGHSVPAEEVAKVRRPGPLGVECPTCRAWVGRPCRTPGGKERASHTARSAAAGLPGVDAPADPGTAAAEIERRRQASAQYLAQGEAS